MRIGIAFDLIPSSREPASERGDEFEEFDKPETIEALAGVLRGEGHEVVFLGDGAALLKQVLGDPPDFVWNLAEGEGVGRCRESRVPAVLEMLGIPHTGSDALALAVALDKEMAKRLVASIGIPVPAGIAFNPRADRDDLLQRLHRFAGSTPFPWLVKPALEGSSKGVRDRCLVDSEEQALDITRKLAHDYQQTILVEQYIKGDEVTVGLIGNGHEVAVLGSLRIIPKTNPDRFIYSLDRKRVWDDQIQFEAPARLAGEVLDRLATSAIAAFDLLGCRDLARVDFRVQDGIPYFLEINPLPGLTPDWSDMTLLARGVGLTYLDLVRRILDVAFSRLGLDVASEKGNRR